MSAHSEGGNNAGWKKAINHDASRSREIVCTCSPVLRAVGRHLCLQVATLWHPEAAWRVSLGTGVGGQAPLSIAPELPSPVRIGKASCWESVCQYVLISGVAVTLKKKITITTNEKHT